VNIISLVQCCCGGYQSTPSAVCVTKVPGRRKDSGSSTTVGCDVLMAQSRGSEAGGLRRAVCGCGEGARHYDSSTLYSLCLTGYFVTQSAPSHLFAQSYNIILRDWHSRPCLSSSTLTVVNPRWVRHVGVWPPPHIDSVSLAPDEDEDERGDVIGAPVSRARAL